MSQANTGVDKNSTLMEEGKDTPAAGNRGFFVDRTNKKTTSADEAKGTFANQDGKRYQSEMDHDFRTLKVNQGWLGRVTGSSDARINIIFFLSTFFLLAIFYILIFEEGLETKLKILALFIAPVTTIIGYLLGRGTG